MKADEPKMVIAVRRDLKMTKEKLAVQVAHASMMFLRKGCEIYVLSKEFTQTNTKITLTKELTEVELEWLKGSYTKVLVGVPSASDLEVLIEINQARESPIKAYPVIDEGRTAFNGVPTLTCVAFGPERSSLLDAVTGHLRLL